MTRTRYTAPPSRLEFGRRVCELRTARGLTLRDAADRLQVSPATMSAIENGKTGVSAERIARLAEELGVPVQSMFGAPNSEQLHQRLLATSAGASAGSHAHDTTRPLSADWRSFPPLMMDQALRAAISALLGLFADEGIAGGASVAG